MKFLKWFYNPFKPHIVKLNTGKYSVRKYTSVGWQYLDNSSKYKYDMWWFNGYYTIAFSQIDTLEGARERLAVYNAQFITGWRVE